MGTTNDSSKKGRVERMRENEERGGEKKMVERGRNEIKEEGTIA